jgi:hypothetical protein
MTGATTASASGKSEDLDLTDNWFMGQYGEAAIIATEYLVQGKLTSPRDAWNLAVSKVSESNESRRKGCPRDAYLGLCDAGLVSGISAGKYGPKNNVNGRYAVNACQLLRSEPSLVTDKTTLWDRIDEPRARNQNGQLDVVVTLWNKGLLI